MGDLREQLLSAGLVSLEQVREQEASESFARYAAWVKNNIFFLFFDTSWLPSKKEDRTIARIRECTLATVRAEPHEAWRYRMAAVFAIKWCYDKEPEECQHFVKQVMLLHTTLFQSKTPLYKRSDLEVDQLITEGLQR